MSFDRLPSLESQPTTSRRECYSDHPEFTALTTSLSRQLSTLISQITQLNRQLSLVGTKKDSERIRASVTSLLDGTRAGFKTVSQGAKRVQNWSNDLSPQQRFAQEALQRQLGLALADFQAAQCLSAEKNRVYVSNARAAQGEEEQQRRRSGDSESGVGFMQEQQQQQAALVEQGEVDFQESMIVAREEEIRGIEHGITELQDIFRDLGMLVTEQEDTLNSIDGNVSRAAQDHKAAHQELQSAARYQKGARNRACCLLLILAVVLAVVLLAVRRLQIFPG